ncbi:hypothetical protein [Nostoc sp.]|uniref:hypothetical protein n=1 Tax=Nostoc sp. TaxID=1180 RepID=UPI002FF9164C
MDFPIALLPSIELLLRTQAKVGATETAALNFGDSALVMLNSIIYILDYKNY